MVAGESTDRSQPEAEEEPLRLLQRQRLEQPQLVEVPFADAAGRLEVIIDVMVAGRVAVYSGIEDERLAGVAFAEDRVPFLVGQADGVLHDFRDRLGEQV